MRNFLENTPAGPITGADSFPGIQGGGDVLFSMAALLVAAWSRGNHTGTQAQSTITGLVTDLAAKANDSAVVHDTGNETIAGVKTFSSAPVVPDDSWSISDTAGLQAALNAKVGGVRVEDEGTPIVAAATGINFVGSGVSVTDAGANEATVTINQSSALGVFYVGAATGVTATDIANTEAAVAAAIAATRGGIVQFGPGLYNLAGIDPILLPESGATGKQVTLQGAGGNNGTILYLPTDGAVGEYFIAGSGLSSAANGSYKTVLRDLTVLGPQAFTAYSTDTATRVPCNLSGLMLDTHVSVYNCHFAGFRYGMQAAGNHSVVRDSTFTNSYIGCRHTPTAGAGGDILFDNVNLSGNTLASHAIANDAVASFTMIRGHVGFAPYGIYFESGGVAGSARLYYSTFIGTSFEFMGNCMLYSPDQLAGVDEVRWENCGNFSTNNATYGLPASSYTNHVFLHTFARSSFRGGSPNYPCTESHFNVTTTLNGVSMDRSLVGMNQSVTDGVPFVKGPATANQAHVVLTDSNFRGIAVPCHSGASGDVVAKTLVEWTQFGNVRPHAYAGTGLRTSLAGVARNSVTISSREYVIVVQESGDQEILMTGGVDPTGTQVLVPSSDATNRSYVMPFTWDGTNATRPIVGQMFLAVAGSASVRARVRFL